MDQRSARNTIHDACTKRLKPDIGNIGVFDSLAEKWLVQGSMQLKNILLRCSKNSSQRDEVISFFNDLSKPLFWCQLACYL